MKKKFSCPSSVCEEGAQMLGVVKNDGTVSILPVALPIDKEFVQRSKDIPDIERRFRFSGTCLEKGCKQWTGHSCGVIENVLSSFTPKGKAKGLPECSLRINCRWFSQEGRAACKACPLVVTDVHA
ncbi:MAG: hypothetical protein JST02_02190 [Bacteroidetes bacterium]|nr:hypothetical protein [Bacteroidota bacterium]